MRHIVHILIFTSITCYSQLDYSLAESYFEEGKYNEAEIIFEAFLSNNPDHVSTREYLGDIAGYQQDWDTAIDYYEKLVDDFEDNADYHFKYGGTLGMKALEVSKIRALTLIGDIRRHLIIASRLDPYHIEARWALVEFYIQLPGIVGGSERKAIKYANELGVISPVDGFLANGYIAEYSKRPKDAERFYKDAIRVGGSPHTYEKLYDLYEQNNEPEKALTTASQSLKIHKRNRLNYQIGKIAAQYNLEPELGISCLHAYIDKHSSRDGVPKNWAYYRLAQIYKNLGQKEKALDWINKALASQPDFKEAKKEKEQIQAL